jgi:uncharacterized membrane protein
MAFGPMQLLVVGFGQGEFHGKIRAELERLRDSDTVRVVDLLAIRKDADGNIERLQLSDLSEDDAMELGAIAGALIGLGAGGEEGAELGAEIGAERAQDGDFLPHDIWYIDDVLPADSAAAVALIEHRWAIGLRDAIREEGGFHLADAWIHPLDLVSIGLIEADEVEEHVTQ